MTLEQLQEELQKYYQFDITSKTRKREVVYAKKVFCKIGYEIGYTYDKVAKKLNSNHDLALYHANSIDCVEDKDKRVFDKIIDDFSLLIPKFNVDKKRRLIKGVEDNLEKQKINEKADLLNKINNVVVEWDRETIQEFIDTRVKIFDKSIKNRIKPKEIKNIPGAKLERKVKNPVLS